MQEIVLVFTYNIAQQQQVGPKRMTVGSGYPWRSTEEQSLWVVKSQLIIKVDERSK